MNQQSETMNTPPYFSFVIPAYNEEEHIGSCLQSIFNSNQDSTRYEVIVVDNGSQDRSYDIAFSFERAKVFKLPQGNVGAVRNYGAAQAQGQMLIFIDADCLIDDGWLNRAEKLIGDHPNSAYGGGVKLPENATWIERAWLLEKEDEPTLPKYLVGASTMLSKDVFFKLSGFDELVSSGEDTDLHHRLVTERVPVIINHALDTTHLGNAKTAVEFLRRQIWHSENYIIRIRKSIKDPVFLITLTFITLPILAFIQTSILPGHNKSIIILTLWIFVPTILSIKRLSRIKILIKNPNKLFKIYFLDFIYLSGRSFGLLKGVLKIFK